MMLKEGSSGPQVSQLHQELIEAGASILDPEKKSSVFGYSTTQAVVSFQAAHGLDPDGVVGPKTWAMLTIGDVVAGTPKGWKLGNVHPDVKPVLDSASALVGTKEDPPGSNRGPVIDQLNKAAGIPMGSPWCAAFATGMWFKSPKNPFQSALGSAYKIRDWGVKNKKSLPSVVPVVPGDIFLVMRTATRGHVGLVACDLGDSVATIEGNAGNGVKRLIRKKIDLDAFVRPLGNDFFKNV